MGGGTQRPGLHIKQSRFEPMVGVSVHFVLGQDALLSLQCLTPSICTVQMGFG